MELKSFDWIEDLQHHASFLKRQVRKTKKEGEKEDSRVQLKVVAIAEDKNRKAPSEQGSSKNGFGFC